MTPMGEVMDSNQLWGIYLLRMVRAVLDDDTVAEGHLTEIRAEDGAVRIDDNYYLPQQIRDLSYVGRVTDYHTVKNYGEIDGEDGKQGIRFEEEDILSATDREALTGGSFDCRVAVHLYMKGTQQAARDVRLIYKAHHLVMDKMGSYTCLFRFADGVTRIGKLTGRPEEPVLNTESGPVPFTPEQVEDITKAPEVNDGVEAELTDGTIKKGVVLAVTDHAINLYSESEGASVFAFSRIRRLFYVGQVNIKPKRIGKRVIKEKRVWIVHSDGRWEDSYLCKPGFFRQPDVFNSLQTGMYIRFTVGVRDDELVAKDAETVEGPFLREGEKAVSGRGLTVYFPDDTREPISYGYIANEYLSNAYREDTGRQPALSTVSFTIVRKDFEFKKDELYYVDYEGASNPEEGIARADRLKCLKIIDKKRTAYASVDENGLLHTVSYGVHYLSRMLQSHVILLHKDGTKTDGTLIACDEETVRVDAGGSEAAVLLEEIDDVCYFGMVLKLSQKSSDGFVGVTTGDGQQDFYFNANRDLNGQDLKKLQLIRPGTEVLFRIAEPQKKNRYLCQATDIHVENLVSRTEVPATETAYIVKYVVNGNFGFMIREEELPDAIENGNRTGTIYFKKEDIIDDGGFQPLSTYTYYYKASCQIRTVMGQTIAKQIRIEERSDFKKKTGDVFALQQPAGIIHNIIRNSTPLESYGALPKADNQHIGLLVFKTTKIAMINSRFINNSYYPDDLPDKMSNVIFDPCAVKTEPEGTVIKPQKNLYLVRYVLSGKKNEQGQAFVDDRYPVEILREIPKTGYRKIEVLEATLNTEENTAVADRSMRVPRIAVYGTDETVLETEIPEFEPGETLIVCFGQNQAEKRVFAGEADGFLLFKGGVPMNREDITAIYRFGIITAFSQSDQTARLNGAMEVSVGIMEPKMLNILKTQNPFSGIHVVYRHDEDHVTEMKLVPDEWMRLVEWEDGKVSECNRTEKRIRIALESGVNVVHVISVKSEPLVSRRFRDRILMGDPVYARKVTFPYMNPQGGMEWKCMDAAIDVRCMYETARIKYDSGKDQYIAERNQTETFALAGGRAFLERYRDTDAEIIFKLSSGDGLFLQAELKAEDDMEESELEETEMHETRTETLIDDPLAQLLMGLVGLRDTGSSRRTDPGEDILPADPKEERRQYDRLFEKAKKKRKMNTDEYLILSGHALRDESLQVGEDADEEDSEARRETIGKWLYHAIRNKQKQISKNPDLMFLEHDCYMSTLLRHVAPEYRNDILYRLFLSDFKSRDEVISYLPQDLNKNRKPAPLFDCKLLDVDAFIGHLMLTDETSFEAVLVFMKDNPALADSIRERAEEIDEMQFRAADETGTVKALRVWYQRNKKQYVQRLKELYNKESVVPGLLEILTDMRVIYVKLIGKAEKDRYEELYGICDILTNYTQRGGFSEQEQALTDAYRRLDVLEKDILDHPGKETVELLICNPPFHVRDHLLSRIKTETGRLMNRLCEDRETLPQIEVVPNTGTILQGQTGVWILVKNNGANPRPVTEVRLKPESYTEGVSVVPELKLSVSTLSSGSLASAELGLTIEASVTGIISIGCGVEYRMVTRYENGVGISEIIRQESGSGTQFELQTGTGNEDQKRVDGVVNPYEGPADGNPITDKTMFFGRKEEKQRILGAILKNEEELNPGATVIIWGQKKCGKTSLVNQIRNKLREEKLRDRSIIISIDNFLVDIGGEEALERFQSNFYSIFLSRFQDEVYDNHPDVQELVDSGKLMVPDIHSDVFYQNTTPLFDRFIHDFQRVDEKQHTIVLLIDEFTMFVMAVLNRIKKTGNESLQSALGFIKTFSQDGFVQIIIGHETMMRALDQLNVINHTAEFAETIEIAALDNEASRELIRKPMEETFGFDVYHTKLGEWAINRLLMLSGRHPTYLMKLCNRMFLYYTDLEKCQGAQILLSDVEKMSREYASELQLDDFESMLVEDGDQLSDAEERDTFKYLRGAARLSSRAIDRMADGAELKKRLQDERMTEETIDLTRRILEKRNVISVQPGGRIRINTGLFTEYYMLRYGNI